MYIYIKFKVHLDKFHLNTIGEGNDQIIFGVRDYTTLASKSVPTNTTSTTTSTDTSVQVKSDGVTSKANLVVDNQILGIYKKFQKDIIVYNQIKVYPDSIHLIPGTWPTLDVDFFFFMHELTNIYIWRLLI